MTTAAKLVQPIAIFLPYLIQLIFHKASWNIVGIFTVVCGSFWRVDKIQNEVTMETEVPK
jgi:positive regulator of sigma E activity